MENNEDKTYVNPIEDQRRAALEHYEELATKAVHWSSFVRNAILAYTPQPEPLEKWEDVNKGADFTTVSKCRITKIGTKEGGFEFAGKLPNNNSILYGGYTVEELHQYVELRAQERQKAIQECQQLLANKLMLKAVAVIEDLKN